MPGPPVTGLHRTARVVVEKPFGRDLASAEALNAVLHGALAEPDIFRIDHYLGKESVENLLVYRFAKAAPALVRSAVYGEAEWPRL